MIFKVIDIEAAQRTLPRKSLLKGLCCGDLSLSLQLVEWIAHDRVEVTPFAHETQDTVYINRCINATNFLQLIK